MKRSILFMMAVSMLTALSCTNELDQVVADSEKELVPMSFTATLDGQTKVEIGSSTTEAGVTTHKMYWSVGDQINVYSGTADNTGTRFDSDIEEASASATFTGTIASDDVYYAFYPCDAGAKWYASYKDFSVTLPSNQVSSGVRDGFAVAKADADGKLQFSHVTGYVKFTIPDDYVNIAKVIFAGNNNESLAGTLYIYPEDASKNYVASKPATEIVMTPNSGEVFTPGTYYFRVFPSTLSEGITITFVDRDGKEGTKSSTSSATIAAGGILNLGKISDLTFSLPVDVPYDIPYSETFATDLGDFSVVDVSNGGLPTNVFYHNSTYTCLYGNAYGATSATESYAISPLLNLTNATEAFLSFDHAVGYFNDATPSDYLSVVVSEDKTTWTALTIPTWPVGWSFVSASNVDLSAYCGKNIYVAFKYTSTVDVKGAWEIKNFKVDTKKDQILSFSASTASATVGEAFTAPTLSGAATTVSYESSDTDVATVGSDGTVTVLAAGETTITATAVATDEYNAASASYTLNVAESGVYEYTFTAKTFSAYGSETSLGDLTWIASATVTAEDYFGYTSEKGQQFGSGSNPCESLTLSTTGYTEKVAKIKVNTSGASSIAATLTVTVNGTSYGESVTLTKTATEYVFDAPQTGAVSGEIQLSWAQTSSKAIYVKSITIQPAD